MTEREYEKWKKGAYCFPLTEAVINALKCGEEFKRNLIEKLHRATEVLKYNSCVGGQLMLEARMDYLDKRDEIDGILEERKECEKREVDAWNSQIYEARDRENARIQKIRDAMMDTFLKNDRGTAEKR